MNQINEIKTLGLDSDDEVKKLLQSAITKVNPIMKKRSWVVTKVEEFFPTNPGLLGLNEKIDNKIIIYIKVRKSKAGIDFFPFEHILGTLLHELCHIEIGPHDQSFYNLLDQLWNECDENHSTTIKGFNANSDGYRLNCARHNPNILDARKLRLQAAEKRIKLNKLTSIPPQKLGGTQSNKSVKDNILSAIEKRANSPSDTS